ncbi:MAG: metal ABC transporter ATP-binding protein [Proteobacteria bacterium]|nr:metal ABC transporter ATP-binding protein [Pseudomonadota bacterium]MBU6426030.1 metal ABC transporter ATP-binding protein [Rhodospirillales bacterium]
MSEAALEVSGLSVSQGRVEVLRGVGFELPRGAFCGLIGSNGAGKTTLLRAILGLLPSQGQIKANGRIGYVPQKILFEPDLPVRARDFVALGLDGHRFGLAFPSRARAEKVEAALRAVEAEGFAGQRIGRLSGGQQQRVMIAHALVRSPDLLLLDEPLANLDIKAAAEIIALLRRLSQESGMTVLLSAHDMNPLLPVMDRILYLAGGSALCGSVHDVVRTEVLSALYGYHIDVIRVHGRVLVVAGGGEHDHRYDHEHVTAIP